MSGPKCETYAVEIEQNELLRRARLSAAQQAASDARVRMESAAAEAERVNEKLGLDALSANLGTVPMPTRLDSIDELERYVAAAESSIQKINLELGKAQAMARLRSLIGASSETTPVSDWSEELMQRMPASNSSPNRALSTARDHRQEAVRRIISRLEGHATDDEQRELDVLSAELLSSSVSSRNRSLESQLKLRVQQVNDRAQRSRRDVTIATDCLGHLRGLSGLEVDALRTELHAIRDGHASAPLDLRERVDAVRGVGEKRANDAYASQVLREEITRLGYVVGPDFSTLFIEGGETVVSRPEQPEYGVEMRVDSSRGILELSVVRFDDPREIGGSDRAVEDRDAEERWCRHHDQLRAALSARGVKGRMIRQLPPGAQPVRVLKQSQATDSRRPGRAGELQREV